MFTSVSLKNACLLQVKTVLKRLFNAPAAAVVVLLNKCERQLQSFES